jgi:hypothetical protein
MAAVEGATRYFATVDGRPAAAGALFVHDGIGHLANASTMPGYRGLGCQTALIERRTDDVSLSSSHGSGSPFRAARHASIPLTMSPQSAELLASLITDLR